MTNTTASDAGTRLRARGGTVRIGSLFTGAGGLDMAVEQVTGASPAWFVEFDPNPSKVLARHWPDVPNFGDVTAVNWAQVDPVDILTAGYPCQPFSHAGKRKGSTDDRHLWPYVADAIGALRPRLVVLENVAGHLSLGGSAVVGDLARLGFDARWGVVRASDAGAAHRRKRLFIVAADNTREHGNRKVERRPRSTEPANGHRGAVVTLLPTPTRRDYKGRNQRNDATCLPGALLPTPVVNDMGAGKTVDDWDAWTGRMRDAHGNGNGHGHGHGKSLAIEAQRMTSTPRATDGTKGGPNQRGSSGDLMLPSAVQAERFGAYQAAVGRWAAVIGRPAPDPTVPGKNGPRLSARFCEWLMGWPDGWVTDTDGISHTAALKIAGNGVVPQQAALALDLLGVES